MLQNDDVAYCWIRQTLAVAAAILVSILVAISAGAQGSIVYFNPTDVTIVSYDNPYSLDLNQDGVTDYVLVAPGGSFDAYGEGQNSSLAVPEQAPDIGAFIVPLQVDDYIGPSPVPPNAWFQTYTITLPSGFQYSVPASFHGCTTLGCLGAFHDTTAYWGVQFSIDGETHYGWVQVSTPGFISNGGTILDWAYNSIPGEPILAGQVPEPSTWALLIGGVSFIAIHQARRLL